MSGITWWLEIATLAFAGGIAIGFGVSWLFLPFRSQVEPGALSEWPPMLGASELNKLSLEGDKAMCKLNHQQARFIAERWRERYGERRSGLLWPVVDEVSGSDDLV